MAKTKTPNDALILIEKLPLFKQATSSSYAVDAINEAARRMWNDHEWDVSLASLPPFYLTPGEADVSALSAPVPSDYAYLEDAWLSSAAGGETVPLTVGQNLTKTRIESTPQKITYTPETDQWRVWPAPASGWSSPDWQIEGRYKKNPPVWDNDDWAIKVLPWDDRFFRVYRKCLEHTILSILGRPEAGQVQFSNGRSAYTGKLAEYKDALHEALEWENAHTGEIEISPEGGSLGMEW